MSALRKTLSVPIIACMEVKIRPLKAPGWKRLVANLIDGAIFFFFSIFFSAIMQVYFGYSRNFERGLAVIAMFIYYALSFQIWNATPGMLIMKIYIGKRFGERVSILNTLIRLLYQLVLATLTFFIVYFWVFSDKRETLYDKISGTYIYQKMPSFEPAADLK